MDLLVALSRCMPDGWLKLTASGFNRLIPAILVAGPYHYAEYAVSSPEAVTSASTCCA